MAKGLLKGIATLLVAGILAGGVCAAGYASRDVNGAWFRESDLKAWTLKDKNKPIDTTAAPWGGVIDNVGNEMNAETTYAMPVAMAFYSTFSDDVAQNSRLAAPSVTVTCSHNFEFNNVLVDWSVEYPSGASAADVVTVTPTSDGSLTANVSCAAPFDTQLTLKATLRDNNEKTATCTIDYVKRIETLGLFRFQGDFSTDEFNYPCKVFVKPTFGVGSVDSTFVINKFNLTVNEEFKQLVKNRLTFNIDFTNEICLENLPITASSDGYFLELDTLEFSAFVNGFDDFDEAHKNAIIYAWFNAESKDNGNKANLLGDIVVEQVYNGKVVSSFTYSDKLTGALIGSNAGSNLSPDLTLNTNVAL